MEITGLRALRLGAVLTQAELAEQAQVCVATVVAAEQGKKVRISTVRKLAWALDVPPRRLLGEAPAGAWTGEDDR